MTDDGKIEVRTPNKPGYSHRVDAAKYARMKAILLKVLPRKKPGMTQTEMVAAVKKAAPVSVFPDSSVQWWVKCVQLDLEARGEVQRDAAAKPTRWWR